MGGIATVLALTVGSGALAVAVLTNLIPIGHISDGGITGTALEAAKQEESEASATSELVGKWLVYAASTTDDNLTVLGATAPDSFFIELHADGTLECSFSEDEDALEGTWTPHTEREDYYWLHIGSMRWIAFVGELDDQAVLITMLSDDSDVTITYVRDK